MKLLAVLAEDAFTALPDETVLGKDSYIKDEKENNYKLALNGEEAGKLATPLQTQLANKKAELDKVHKDKNDLAAKVAAFEKLGKTTEEIDAILKAGKTETIEELEKGFKAKEESLRTASDQAIAAARAEMEAAAAKTGEIEKQLATHMRRTLIAELKNEYGMNALGDDYLSNRLEVVRDDSGQYITRVVINGEPAYKAGALMTPKQLAEEAKANRDLAGMFNAGTGGGSGGSNNQGGTSLKAGTVLATDQAGMSANLEDIASGKVTVR